MCANRSPGTDVLPSAHPRMGNGSKSIAHWSVSRTAMPPDRSLRMRRVVTGSHPSHERRCDARGNGSVRGKPMTTPAETRRASRVRAARRSAANHRTGGVRRASAGSRAGVATTPERATSEAGPGWRSAGAVPAGWARCAGRRAASDHDDRSNCTETSCTARRDGVGCTANRTPISAACSATTTPAVTLRRIPSRRGSERIAPLSRPVTEPALSDDAGGSRERVPRQSP